MQTAVNVNLPMCMLGDIPHSRDYYPRYYYNLGIFWVNFYLVKNVVY